MAVTEETKDDVKNSTLRLKLDTDSGYSMNENVRISLNQWTEICKIIHTK